LTVYAPGPPTDGLDAVVESIPDLAVGEHGDNEVQVVRGKRGTYSFTVFGPYSIEPEDVPDDVMPHVLDPNTSWQVVVEGSSPTETRVARRFAKQLALAAGGVAFDEQTEEILGAKRSRKVARPEAPLVHTFELNWYSPVSDPPPPRIWLDLATSFFPEALPRRYGEWEPLKYRLDRDGSEPFVDSYDPAHLDFFGTLPCLDGTMFPHPWGEDGLQYEGLNLLAAPMDEPGWRNTVRRFFVEFARRRRSLLATGEICRNMKLTSGNRLDSTDTSDRYGEMRGLDTGLLGLPANPIWWTWFGQDYLPLVGEYLPAEHTTYYDEGALYVPTELPADRPTLAALPDPFPADLRVTVIPPEFPSNRPKNAPAARRPRISQR
jgi:hypothetical protein